MAKPIKTNRAAEVLIMIIWVESNTSEGLVVVEVGGKVGVMIDVFTAEVDVMIELEVDVWTDVDLDVTTVLA